MNRFLENRDEHFDNCRAFLVIAMIIAHTFQMYYRCIYNHHITYFVPIEFVFLSGFTLSAINAPKMINQSSSINIAIFKRAIKIIALFFICNLFIISLTNEWTLLFSTHNNNFFELIIAILTGADRESYSFEVLIPIGFTMLLSIVILSIYRTTVHLLLLLMALFTIHILSKWTGWATSYGASMLLIGCIGSTMGILCTYLNWDKFIQLFTTRKYLIVLAHLFIVAYVATASLIQGNTTGQFFYYHLIPSIILLLAVYILSVSYHLENKPIIGILQQTLSKYLLFAYLFHIAIIRLTLLFIPSKIFSVWETMIIALLLFLFTVSSCYVLDILVSRMAFVRKSYSFIFK